MTGASQRLMRQGATREVLTVLAARMLAKAATDPDLDWSVPAMRQATGLTTWEIESVFQQDWFTAMLQESCRNRTMKAVSTAVLTLESLLHDDSSRIRLDAARAIIGAWKTLVDTEVRHDSKDAAEQVRTLLSEMKNGRVATLRLARKAANASHGTVHPHPDAAESDQDKGRDRAAGEQ